MTVAKGLCFLLLRLKWYIKESGTFGRVAFATKLYVLRCYLESVQDGFGDVLSLRSHGGSDRKAASRLPTANLDRHIFQASSVVFDVLKQIPHLTIEEFAQLFNGL